MGELGLVADCVDGLRAALPVGAEVEVRHGEFATGDTHVDGWLRVRGPWGETEVPFESKRRVTQATIALIDRRLRECGQRQGEIDGGDVPRWALLTEHVAARQARELRERGIAFADTRGNVSLWGPGLYVWVAGNRPAAHRPKTPRLTRPAAARVLFALLQNPRRVEAPYREIAELAGVAPDTVNRVFNDLQDKGYMKVWGARERALTRLPELTELWILAYEDALRPKLQPNRCQWAGGRHIEEMVNRLSLAQDEAPILLGGELAAAVLTDAVRPTTATLHVAPGTHRMAMGALRLIPRTDGPITLLHTFGETNGWTPPERELTHLADPLLVYAELMREHDDRARTAAEELYDRYIATRFQHDP